MASKIIAIFRATPLDFLLSNFLLHNLLFHHPRLLEQIGQLIPIISIVVLHLQALLSHASLDMMQHCNQMIDDDLLQPHHAHSPIDKIARLYKEFNFSTMI
jgi:hypothetical protein